MVVLTSRECSVPSTGCVGEDLSVSVCISDGGAVVRQDARLGVVVKTEASCGAATVSWPLPVGMSSASSTPCHPEAWSVVMSR